MLTIPVEGGYSGGKINIEHEGLKHSFQFERNNDRYFSLVAFFEDCQHELESISDGWMLAMVFHIVWKDAIELDIAPLEFPTFIKACNEINEELSLWSSPSYTKKFVKEEKTKALETDIHGIASGSKNENLNFSAPDERFNISSNSGICLVFCSIRFFYFLFNRVIFDFAERIDEITSSQSKSDILQASDLMNPTEEERFLFFPLEGKYDDGLSFTQLRGRDRLMYHIFQSTSYLDVHLAVMSQLTDSCLDFYVNWELTTNWTERNFRINEWIKSAESMPLFKQVELDARTQLVGNIDRITRVENGPNVEVNQNIYYHYVLIIQPRYQPTLHACRYQLDAVLDYMEQKLPRILEVPKDVLSRQKLVMTLNHVISFSMKEPVLVWMDPNPATSQRPIRLLELCLKLKAKQEGLNLLESMGTAVSLQSTKTECPPSGIPNLFVEGIRDEMVAKAIAKFESRVSGTRVFRILIA